MAKLEPDPEALLFRLVFQEAEFIPWQSLFSETEDWFENFNPEPKLLPVGVPAPKKLLLEILLLIA